MELLNSFFHFLTDKSKVLSHKAILIILSISFLIVLDNTFSFSYYFNTKSKIEQVNGINEILSDTTLTEEERLEIEKFRNDIIFRTTWKDKTWKLVSEIEFNTVSNDTTSQISKDKLPERSYFWHFISSGWLFILFMIIMPIAAFIDENTSAGVAFAMLIILEPMLYMMAWSFAKLFSFIPLLFSDPFYNYLSNFFLSLFIIVVISLLSSKKKEKDKLKS